MIFILFDDALTGENYFIIYWHYFCCSLIINTHYNHLLQVILPLLLQDSFTIYLCQVELASFSESKQSILW